MAGLFNTILKDNESLFMNELALDYGFIPKVIPFRENQQQYIASCIKPLFNSHSGKNLLITGSPGIGKTLAARYVLKQLEDETGEIIPLYINCWKKNTNYKALVEICNLLNIKFILSLTTDQLAKRVSQALSRKPVVLCLDEIDKLENQDLLYTLTEDIQKKTILLITNEVNWLSKLDPRVSSRLSPEMLAFKPYSQKEVYEILKQRIEYAFYPKVFDIANLDKIAELSFHSKDIRAGIYLLKESGLIAEEQSSRIITQEHINQAVSKFQEFQIRNKQDLPDPTQDLLEFIKTNQNKASQELYNLYSPKTSYKTFHRRLQEMEKAGLIKLELKQDGPGKATIVKLSINPENKTLDSY
ncbi:MAG TPA: AAA family ATPase [Candidatus Nanoarchaeia archaeon]|nr:AAA family ATPase [Candidatus Nanoarchaeia archaeon]